jgi:excisionase family DNA binding protein
MELVHLCDPDPATALARLRQTAAALRSELAAVETAIAAFDGLLKRPEAASTLLTVAEAAAELRVSKSTVFSLLKTGKLTGIKLGRDRCVHRASILALLDQSGAA